VQQVMSFWPGKNSSVGRDRRIDEVAFGHRYSSFPRSAWERNWRPLRGHVMIDGDAERPSIALRRGAS
jgi:hypothetical protein